jgi:hypothetical protein
MDFLITMAIVTCAGILGASLLIIDAYNHPLV